MDLMRMAIKMGAGVEDCFGNKEEFQTRLKEMIEAIDKDVLEGTMDSNAIYKLVVMEHISSTMLFFARPDQHSKVFEYNRMIHEALINAGYAPNGFYEDVKEVFVLNNKEMEDVHSKMENEGESDVLGKSMQEFELFHAFLKDYLAAFDIDTSELYQSQYDIISSLGRVA